MTSPTNPDRWSLSHRRERARPTWPRVAVLIGLIVVAVFVSKSCQQSQIRISQDEAIALAKEQVKFEPRETQIRLLRQGLNRQPFWFVSLSNPIGSPTDPEGFSKLAVVKIDANKGTVESVELGRPPEGDEEGGKTGGEPAP